MVNPLLVVTFLGVFITALGGKHDIYSGFSVHRVMPRSAEDCEFLSQLENTLNLDEWEAGLPNEREFLYMVSPDNLDTFLEELDARNLQHTVHRSDVARSFEEFDEHLSAWRNSRNGRMELFEDYLEYPVIEAYLDRIATEYPNLVTLVEPGLTFEGRTVKYLKISTTNFTDTSKPIYHMDAMIHAREWVTTPVALYAIHRLVEDLREEDRDLLENIDWIIMPVANPDGYQYTHDVERLWRKTRSYNFTNSEGCYGIDGNRNFDVAFNTVGVSSDPCQNTYPGVEPFSEVETGYMRDIMLEYLDRIALYMNIHSHGNWILYAYGDRSLPPNGLELFHVGAAMGAAIDSRKLPEAQFYRVGNSAMLLYGTSGTAQDYAQHVGIRLSYTLELPGYGVQFEVPPRYIPQINVETWDGIAVTARLARSYYRSSRP